MNVAQFYTELFEQTLGLDVLGLESQFPALIELVETKTLREFSNYIHAEYKMYLDLTDKSNIIPKVHQTLGVEYYLHDEVLDKYNLPIMDIININYNNVADVDPYDPDSSSYYSSVIASRNNLTLEALLMGAEYSYSRTLSDTAMPWKRESRLIGDRVLWLRNYAFGGTVELECKIPWPNLVSVPPEFYSEFMYLAKLDCKIYLWNQLKYLENIVTPVGNMDLKVSDWENADRERDDYLKELRTKSFPDRVLDKYFRLV